MKKILKAIKTIIIAWFEAEQKNTETPMERTNRMAGSNFWL